MIPVDLEPARIAALLSTRRYGRSLDVRAVTESTNDDARAAAERGAPDGHVVVADHQQAGRGRLGRSWSSPAGTDLYLSIVARPGLEPGALPPITLAVGLAAAEAAEALSGAAAEVKWPNDVWLHRRKCAGMLVETVTRDGRADAVILGIGLNVNRRAFEPELAETATSLALARQDGADVDRAVALATLLASVERWIDRLVGGGPAAIVAALVPRLALRGERVRVDTTEGVIEGVAPSGALRVRRDDGRLLEVVAGSPEPLPPLGPARS